MQNKQTSSTTIKISDRDLSFISKAYESIVLLKSLNSNLDILPRSDLYKIIARFALANLGAATQSLSYECTTEIYPNLSNLLFTKTQGSINTAWWSSDRFALAHTLNISEMLVDIDSNFGEELKAANLVFEALKRILTENKSRIKNFSMSQNFKLVDVSIDLSKYFPTYDITDVNDCLDFLKKVSSLKVSDTRSILLAVGFEILGNCVSKYSGELEKVGSKKEIRFLRNRIAHEGSVVSCIKTNYASYLTMLSDFDGVIPVRNATASSESSASAVEVDPANNASKKTKKKINEKSANSSNSSAQKRKVNQVWSFENDLSVSIDPNLLEAIKEFKKQFPKVVPENGLYNREFFSRTFYNAAVGSSDKNSSSPYNFELFCFISERFKDFIDLSSRVFVYRADEENGRIQLNSVYDLSPFFMIDGIANKESVESAIMVCHDFKFIGYPLKHVNGIRQKLRKLEGEKGYGLEVLDALSLFWSAKAELYHLKYKKSDSILGGAKIIKDIEQLVDIESYYEVMHLFEFYSKGMESQIHRKMIDSYVNDGFLNAIDSDAPTKWNDDLPFWIYMISSKFPCLDLNMKRSCDFRHFKRKEDYLVDVNLNFFAAWVNYRLSYIDPYKFEVHSLENEKGTDTPKVLKDMERNTYPEILDRAYSLFFCDSGLLGEICQSESEINQGKSHSLLSYLSMRLDYLEKTPKDSILNFPLLRGVFEKLYLAFFLWNEIIGLEKDDVIIDLIQGECSIEKLAMLSEELPKIQDRKFCALAETQGLTEKINLAQAILFVIPEEAIIEPNSAIAKYVELHKASLPTRVQDLFSKAISSNSLTASEDCTEEDRSDFDIDERYKYLSETFKKVGDKGLGLEFKICNYFEGTLERSNQRKAGHERGI